MASSCKELSVWLGDRKVSYGISANAHLIIRALMGVLTLRITLRWLPKLSLEGHYISKAGSNKGILAGESTSRG